jgi:hypothetical protein
MNDRDEMPKRRRALTKGQIAADLSVSTRHVDRLNIPGKTYAFGPRSPRWWEDQYESWKESLRVREGAAA